MFFVIFVRDTYRPDFFWENLLHLHQDSSCCRFLTARGYGSDLGTTTGSSWGHALEKGHYVWMNAADGKVYCIPDGYEVVDKSLEVASQEIYYNIIYIYIIIYVL
jgi:hypothetical protein